MTQTPLTFLGLGIAAATLASILWSIAVPERRIWPPRRYTAITPVLVWGPTLSLFGILIVLGVSGWGDLAFPVWLRFGVGIPLIAVGVRCRLHGFTIHQELQRGVVPELVYPVAPDEIIHSWVEVETENGWANLEGFILDSEFLAALQSTFSDVTSLCGYGAGTDCLMAPPVEWTGGDTYIQKTGIVQDFGTFDTPDNFYANHRQSFSFVKGLLYRHVVRHWMNARVRRIRTGLVPRIPGMALSNHHHEGSRHAS